MSADLIVTYSTNREWNITKGYVNSLINWKILLITRETYCQTIYFVVSAKITKFWKKSLNGHATVVGDHATVGGCQTTFLTYNPKFWEKSVNGHSRVVWRSRDRRLTVKQFVSTFQQKWQHFEKKSLYGLIAWNVEKDVVWQSGDGRVTSYHCRMTGRSVTFFKFSQLLETSKKVVWQTVDWLWRDLQPLSRDRSATFSKFAWFAWNLHKSCWPFSDFRLCKIRPLSFFRGFCERLTIRWRMLSFLLHLHFRQSVGKIKIFFRQS